MCDRGSKRWLSWIIIRSKFSLQITAIHLKEKQAVRYGSILPMAKRFMPVCTRLDDPLKQEWCFTFYPPMTLQRPVCGALFLQRMTWNRLSCSSCPGEQHFPLWKTSRNLLDKNISLNLPFFYITWLNSWSYGGGRGRKKNILIPKKLWIWKWRRLKKFKTRN